MNKICYYVLTSHNIYALRRHLEISRIPKDYLKVIINSLDKEYILEAVKYCVENDLNFIVTESNGTAAKGKNSFLDTFLASDNDYAVFIDGDDFLTPHGVFMYALIAASDNPPDAISLVNQVSIWPTSDSINFKENKNKNPEEIKECEFLKFFTVQDWDQEFNYDSVKDRLLSLASEETKKTLTKFQLDSWVQANINIFKLCKNNVHSTDSHSRVTFISKKAAMHRFDEKFKVGEDTLNFLDLKEAAMKGEITMYTTDEETPSYIYDMRISGVAGPNCTNIKDFLEWAEPFAEELEVYKNNNRLYEEQLPELKINYPLDYEPNLHYENLVCCKFDVIDRRNQETYVVSGPSNSSEDYLYYKVIANLNSSSN